MRDAAAWIDERLAEAGLKRTGDVEEHRVRPWGTVLRAATDGGRVWLKAPGPRTAFEVPLYELLVEVVPDRVLAPLGADRERGWVLLPDGGEPLGEHLQVEDLAQALASYGQLQRELAPHAGRMLELGLVGMRPQAMPARFDEAVEAVGGDPQVEAMRETYREWCERLAASPVPASIDHNDLHPWNILDGARFYDWGDAVVAHPFASMLGGLGFSPIPAESVPGVRDAYLEGFAEYGSHDDLVAELELACRVAKVARALTWHRAVADTGGEHADAPREALASLLDESYLGRV